MNESESETESATHSPGPSIELASRTDVGRVRSTNEDSCEMTTRSDGTQLLVVADGMGGHRGGATASGTAISIILETFAADSTLNIETVLRRGIEAANERIYEMGQADAELEGMGTTVVALVLDSRRSATIAHVGDSRAYRYRCGHLTPLTTDHSVVAEMQNRGLLTAEEAATHPRRNEILRSVGVTESVEVEVASVGTEPGDRYLLCSDGLSGVLTDEEIAVVIRTKPAQEAVDTLVALANERGGPDNITVQILALSEAMAPRAAGTNTSADLPEVSAEAVGSKRPDGVPSPGTKRTRWTRKLALALLLIGAAAAAWLFIGAK